MKSWNWEEGHKVLIKYVQEDNHQSQMIIINNINNRRHRRNDKDIGPKFQKEISEENKEIEISEK